MYDDILLPTDGSTATVQALDHAVTIADDQNATVHVLYVVDRRNYLAADADVKDEIRRSLEEEGERALDDARIRLDEDGIDFRTATREGIPYRTIVEYADEEGMDLIVMGTHGKTGAERVASLGSTTERVVKDSKIPVLVVELD
ncbi:universal stress protein [Halovenus marina]|uniref:universal stress protein n=1 Tax=Halovenus marina TaxID=3396621 RepID=UPI003F553019